MKDLEFNTNFVYTWIYGQAKYDCIKQVLMTFSYFCHSVHCSAIFREVSCGKWQQIQRPTSKQFANTGSPWDSHF